jgi:hypothetical protein
MQYRKRGEGYGADTGTASAAQNGPDGLKVRCLREVKEAPMLNTTVHLPSR